MTDPERREVEGDARGATRVASGIAASRVLGLVREVLIARFLGVGAWADVFRTALRGPNLLQNLLGEQTLSAAFIPVYSRMEAAGSREDAARFAGAVFGLLFALVAGLVLAGELLAEPIVALLSSGYLGDSAAIAVGEATVDRFPLAVAAVRWILPMAGLLVLSAWTLAVLNSHRRFLLPYLAPALWNAAIIAALWSVGSAGSATGGEAPPSRVLEAACVGALIGGALQFLVQLPSAVRRLAFFRPSLDRRARGVREAWRAFLPLVTGRGAVQLSSYLDNWLASFLRAGAQSALGFAQGLYLLPVSLFGMSVAAAELPELARRAGDHGAAAERLAAAARQSAFLAIPAAIGYLCFGFPIVRGLFGGGTFGPASTWLVTGVLAAYSAGLPASVLTRQLNNLFFAAGLTRPPARAALERMLLSAAAGTGLMLWLDRMPLERWVAAGPGERSLHWGSVGLAIGATLGAWYELVRVRRLAQREWPAARLPARRLLGMAGLAALAAVPAALAWRLTPALPAAATVAIVLAVYVTGYLAGARALGISEVTAWLGRFARRKP